MAPQDAPETEGQQRKASPDAPSAQSVRKELHWLEVLNFIGQLVLATVGVIAACIYGKQLTVMGQQLTEMKNATNASLASAYDACVATQVSRSSLIEVERGEAYADEAAKAARVQAIMATRSQVAYIVPIIQGGIVPSVGAFISMPFNFKNAGNSAAKGIVGKVRVLLVSRNEDPEFTYPKGSAFIDTPQLAAGETPGSLSIPGGSVFAMDAEGRRLRYTEADIQDMNEGRKDVILLASITYSDMAGVSHWRNVCRTTFSINPTNGSTDMLGHRKCIHYNQEDQNSGFPAPQQPSVPVAEIPQISCPVPVYEK